LLFCSAPFSYTASATPSNTTNIQDAALTKTDKDNIKESINEVLSLKYEVLKTGQAKDYSYIVKDPNLLELLNKKSKLDVEWFKKFDGSTDGYTSNVTITNSTKTAADTYVVDVLYSVEFKLKGADTVSKSSGEKYQFEVKYGDGKWYITKMLDLIENSASTNNQVTQNSLLKSNDDFQSYNENINAEIQNIDDKYQNMDENYKYFIKSDSTTDNQGIRPMYSGYNATAAVAYAHTYATSPNYSTYPGSYTYVYADQDCTDFVSQCALAGGIPATSYWYAYSNPWIRVLDFYDYMISNGYASSVAGPRGAGTAGARAGDVVQFSDDITFIHSVILTGTVNGGNWVYCGHSKNRLDYPLYDIYDQKGYTSMRTIKFWH
jgi:hypothetical protein